MFFGLLQFFTLDLRQSVSTWGIQVVIFPYQIPGGIYVVFLALSYFVFLGVSWTMHSVQLDWVLYTQGLE